jgi:catechol 2,3-dioxygenase-like lactoylglutathione lyase family enzyme
MTPRISFITLGVESLERSLRFYRDGLGLPATGILGGQYEYGAAVFIDMQPGLKLALWPRASIARDAGLPVAPPAPTDFTLAHNVAAREEVDALMRRAAEAGATIVKPAQPAFWGGYAGYFQDPDGHLWEIAWNPDFPLPVD